MKSLKAEGNVLADSHYPMELLETDNHSAFRLIPFQQNMERAGAASNVMCRNTISIGWDGDLYDCDFNQMLDLKVSGTGKHISAFSIADLLNREIIVNQHCYGCTAGAGSSCGGAVA